MAEETEPVFYLMHKGVYDLRKSLINGPEKSIFDRVSISSDSDAYWVYDDLTHRYRSATIFLFESQYAEKSQQHKCFSEDDLRRIIREELKSFAGSVAKTASDKDRCASDTLEQAALSAIDDVMEQVAGYFPHGWACPKRNSHYEQCNCGVE